jgi:hypothetical protein
VEIVARIALRDRGALPLCGQMMADWIPIGSTRWPVAQALAEEQTPTIGTAASVFDVMDGILITSGAVHVASYHDRFGYSHARPSGASRDPQCTR